MSIRFFQFFAFLFPFSLSVAASNVAKDSAKGSELSDIHDPKTDGTDRDFLADSTTARYREFGAALTFVPFEWF